MKRNTFTVIMIIFMILLIIIQISTAIALVDIFDLTATTPIGARVISDSIILNIVRLTFGTFVMYLISDIIYRAIISRKAEQRFKLAVKNIVQREKDRRTNILTKPSTDDEAYTDWDKMVLAMKPVQRDDIDIDLHKPYVGQPQFKMYRSYQQYAKAVTEWYNKQDSYAKVIIDIRNVFEQNKPEEGGIPYKLWYQALPEEYKTHYNKPKTS